MIAFQSGVLHFVSPDYNGFIDLEQQSAELRLAGAAAEDGIDYFLRAALALLAFRQGGLLFHGAALLQDDQVLVLFGPSGAGKTTAARHAGRARRLNDDLILLMPGPEGWMAGSSPFTNLSQSSPQAGGGRLGGLYRLVQASQPRLLPLSQAAAVGEILSCIPLLTSDPERLPAVITRAQELTSSMPVMALHFLPDDSYWSVLEPVGSLPNATSRGRSEASIEP
jgi:hypothetical protein